MRALFNNTPRGGGWIKAFKPSAGSKGIEIAVTVSLKKHIWRNIIFALHPSVLTSIVK